MRAIVEGHVIVDGDQLGENWLFFVDDVVTVEDVADGSIRASTPTEHARRGAVHHWLFMGEVRAVTRLD